MVKRMHLVAPTALALDHVRRCVVQCLKSHHDVVAFLRALPASSLDAPLTALLELMTTSFTCMEHWPEIAPDFLKTEELKLALTALPALPKIFIYDAVRFEEQYPVDAALQWLANFTHLGNVVNRSMVDDFKSRVKQYKRLESVRVYAGTFACLAPSLPPRLRHLKLFCDSEDNDSEDDDSEEEDSEDEESEEEDSEDEDSEGSEDDNNDSDHGSENDVIDVNDVNDTAIVDSNLARALKQWLDNGKSNKHVTFKCTMTETDAAGVADVLVSCTSIATLEIDASAELVQALLARTELLSHLPGFIIKQSSVNEAMQLVARLDPAKLTRLEVAHMSDLGWVLPLLPTMPNLQELKLGFGHLDDVPSTLAHATPRLRALGLYSVVFSDKAFDAFFEWTLGLRQLRSVICSAISFQRHRLPTLRTMLRHWINKIGVTDVRLVYSTPPEVEATVSVLQSLPPSSSLTFLDIDDIGNNHACLQELIQWIAHRVNTTVKFEFTMNDSQFRAIKTTALADYGVDVSRLYGDDDNVIYYLHSPRR